MMGETLNISGIVEESIVDGPGIRFVIFTQGCPHNCQECHNPQTHDINGGKEVKIQTLVDRINKNSLINGITLSGGEPMLQAKNLCILAKQALKLNKNVIIYSGYTFEEILGQDDFHANELLSCCMYLIDGKYISDQKNSLLKFRGSENQRIIDVKRSLQEGKAIIAQI